MEKQIKKNIEAAKLKNLGKSKKLIRLNKQKRIKEKLLTRKLGLLRKANVLYKSQRYNEAFMTIIQAVKQVKEEKI